MRSSIPGLAQRARLLANSGDALAAAGSGNTSSSRVFASALRQHQAALTGTTRKTPPPPGNKPNQVAEAAASPAAAAAAPSPAAASTAAAGGQQSTTAATPASTAPGNAAGAAAKPAAAPAAAGTTAATSGMPSASSSSNSLESGGAGSSTKKKGGGWGLALLALGSTGAAYLAYENSKSQYESTVDGTSSTAAGGKQLTTLLEQGKEAVVSSVAGILPADLADKLRSAALPSTKAPEAAKASSSTSSDRLSAQKQQDADDLGFKMLPPEDAVAAAQMAAADAAAAASAAARDALSAAADEFPGLTDGAGAAPAASTSTAAPTGAVDLSTARIEEIDMSPINALFAEVTATDLSSTAPSTPAAAAAPDTSSRSAQEASASEQSAAGLVSAVTAVATAKRQQGAAAGAAPPPSRSDSELDSLRSKLGFSQDLTPAGLIAAANAAGLGAYSSSSGAPLPPQLAQLNQASADARLLGSLLQQLAAQQAALEKQLAAAQQEKEWAAAESQKREESLTEHFKELLREQTRIQQTLTAQAVRQAEEVVVADTARAQLQERHERLAVLDELRATVNALTLAFNQRTAEVKSAHEVHKVHLGALALSRALEQGQAIGPQLQYLAAGCPGDAVVEAVAASLPASASTAGLPTTQQLQQSFSGVAQRAAEAAYFTGEDDGGVLAHLFAKLAVKLKVDLPDAEVEGPDSKISQARVLLQEGKLLAAADALSAAGVGSQAASVVQQWVQDARARAVADQAVKLLQAYATTTAATRA